MMTRNLIYFLLFIFVVCPAKALNSIPDNSNDFSEKQKIRAGYMGTKNIDVLPKMAEAGMNTALVKFNQIHIPLRNDELKLLKKWAMACKKAGLKFMPVINLWGYHEKRWIKPKYHLYYDGAEFDQTPCPLEAEVYNLAVHQRVLEIAKLSHEVPIDGVVIDLEMYEANVTSYPYYCLCDYCFERFLAGKTVSKPLAADERENYLVRTKQVDAYRIFTSNYIDQLVSKTKQAVGVLSPRFIIGAFHLDLDKIYNMGFAKGLESRDSPAFAFTERTYSTGYSAYIRQVLKRFKKFGLNVKLVVGIWQDKFPPENLAEQYYHCAKDSAGYWIYTIESLSAHTQKTLPFAKNRYWSAINKANEELKKIAVNPGYKSTLKIRPFDAPAKPLTSYSINVESVEYVNLDIDAKGATKTLTLRGLNKLVFIAQKGDQLDFEIDFDKMRGNNKYHADSMLISQQGDVLAKDTAKLYSNAKLRLTAPYSGTYAIAIETYGNSAEIVKYSHPYSINASGFINLLKPNGTLYLYKPETIRLAEIVMQVDGIGESVTATFRNQTGRILCEYDVIGKQAIEVPFGANPIGEVIELNIKPRTGAYFEDVKIKVISGFEKYISPTRYGIVKRTK